VIGLSLQIFISAVIHSSRLRHCAFCRPPWNIFDQDH